MGNGAEEESLMPFHRPRVTPEKVEKIVRLALDHGVEHKLLAQRFQVSASLIGKLVERARQSKGATDAGNATD